MPIAGSFSGASARGVGEFNLKQDFNASAVIYAISNITGATPSSPSAGSCTYTTQTPHFLQVGWSVTIANVGGASSGSFSGSFTVTAVTPLTFRVANSVAGTATFSTNGITATVTPPSTWVCPPDVYSVEVLAIGGGGGGGSVINTSSTKTPAYTYTAGPAGGASTFGYSGNTYISAGGGSGQTQGTGSGQTIGTAYASAGGTATIGAGGSSGGYSGGQGFQGGGGAGGYAGAGGSSRDNSTFTISTAAASTSQSIASPPSANPGTYNANLIQTSTNHNYSVGEIVNISGVNTTFSTSVTSIVGTSSLATVNVTSGGSQFLANDSVTITGLTDYVSGTTTSLATTQSSKNITYTATNNFVATQLVQLSGASSIATITKVGATTSLITYTCANSLTTGQLVTISGLSRTAYNITGFVSSASSTQFTIAGTGFTALTAVADSGSVYNGHGNSYVTILSATASTFVVDPNGNNLVTGTACGTTRTITPTGTIKATFPGSSWMGSSWTVTSSTATTIVIATFFAGTLPSQSGTVSATPIGPNGYNEVISIPNPNQFYAYPTGSSTLRAGTGGTVTRIGQNGTGGSAASSANNGALVSGSATITGGGGTWLNGYVSPTTYSGYAGSPLLTDYMGGSAVVPITSAIDNGSGSTVVFTVASGYDLSTYLPVGSTISLAGLTSPYNIYIGSATVTAATSNTFSIASAQSAKTSASQSAFVFVRSAAGGSNLGLPSSSSYTNTYGGTFGGGGAGPIGSGGGGALAWANGISVVPGRSYTVSPGAGGQASIGTNTYYSTDGGGGHGVIRIMYGQTKAWPTTNVS